MSAQRWSSTAAAIAVTAFALAACGDDNAPKAPAGVSQSAFERQLADAQRVSPADFPATGGKTLRQLADTANAGQEVGLATSVFVPGYNRLAFGVIDPKAGFVYGKTAVYIGRSPNSKAQGPYPAPADSLLTEGRYRSKQAALEAGPIASVYAAQVPFKRPGRYAMLVHQEVYVDNEVSKGLRPPLKAFGLQTEPWLFTFDRSGRVAARLEGSFGTRAFEQAITAALR